MRREYLQIIYLIRAFYLEYLTNSYNSIIKKNEKMKNGLNKHFSQEDIKIVNNYMKRCLTSPVIWEM